MVSALPIDSALARSMNERLAHGWGHAEELLAVQAELIDQGNRLTFAANAKKGAQHPQPIFIPRPGQTKTKRQATAQELKVLFGKQGVKVIKRKKREETD